MKVVVTGAAGFIGMHVVVRLLERGDEVIGVDDLNDYYDVNLKRARLSRLSALSGFSFHQVDIADHIAMEKVLSSASVARVVHLAAQPGVRHSVKHPRAYATANLVGFVNILEICRELKVEHLVYASSSSVYGGNTRMPFGESDVSDHPMSLYAATKKSNEVMAHSYSHLYGLPTSGMRFFSVYGPWGRPDMALFSFTKAIFAGDPIMIYNHGHMHRDFTYIDDIVDSVIYVLDRPPTANSEFDKAKPDSATSWAPYRLLNVGTERPVSLLDFVSALEAAIGRPAIRKFVPMQAGDVSATFADMGRLSAMHSGPNAPAISIEEGTRRFVKWYREYFNVS